MPRWHRGEQVTESDARWAIEKATEALASANALLSKQALERFV
jgi:hypothetical protein